jgi:biotin/methionine sulfoxide reductase
LPDTIVVHDPWWTAAAKHADVVIPSTTSLERRDLGANVNDRWLHAMHAITPRVGQARDDYEVFASLTASVLGDASPFTEGRTQDDWIQSLYEDLEKRCATYDWKLPSFEELWHVGFAELPVRRCDHVLMADFRDDPERSPLATPSGRIELFSSTIASFGYDDCPPHPMWLEPREWRGSPMALTAPLHLIANQPAGRLHSQLDMGAVSQSKKTAGRETLRMHPADANARGIGDADVARVFNDRGSCLAGVVITEDVRPGVVSLSTGAWFDPLDLEAGNSMCIHGNANVLTSDRGTSSLAQGCTGQLALVQVERFDGVAPEVRAHQPPQFVERL